MSTEPRSKDDIRPHVWQLLQERSTGRGDVHGHVPDFVGSEQAVARLAELPGSTVAQTVKANPDEARSSPVWALALTGGKLLFMTVPRLARPRC